MNDRWNTNKRMGEPTDRGRKTDRLCFLATLHPRRPTEGARHTTHTRTGCANCYAVDRHTVHTYGTAYRSRLAADAAYVTASWSSEPHVHGRVYSLASDFCTIAVTHITNGGKYEKRFLGVRNVYHMDATFRFFTARAIEGL